MDNSLFNAELASERAYIEALLDKYVPKAPEYGRICESMRYSVLNGGKRLRAIMLIKSFEMFGGSERQRDTLCAPFAAALECIHAYSLVHDDLPAMDNDVLRRGKPTTHVEFGHAMGILAGDALLSYAFEIITSFDYSEAASEIGYDRLNSLLVKCINILSSKAGYNGMIGGQVLDTCTVYLPELDYTAHFPEIESIIQGIECDINLLKYTLRIYELKTSQLIEIALMTGAVLAGAANSVNLMEEAGRALGLAFQIQDDILDLTSDTETLGKSVNIDERNQKKTIARQIGIENSQKLVKMYTELAVSCLEKSSANNEFLSALFKSLIYRRL